MPERSAAVGRPEATSHISRQPRRGALERLRVGQNAADVDVVLSAIVCAVRALPVILTTGAIGLPVGVPRRW